MLGSGRHNPTLMRRHQRVAGEAWRVRATSGVGASEPALPCSLRGDLVLYCWVMSYSVLILSTTVAIPQRCRQRLHRHRHRHPRRTAAAALTAAAAAAVRRLLCWGCGWCLLRLVKKFLIKKWLFCCCGDDRGDRARPSCCAATHLAEPSPPPPPPPLLLRLRLRLRLRCCYCAAAAAAVLLCCCCLSDGIVLGLPLPVSLGAAALCLNSKFDVAPPLPACDMDAVYAFCEIRSPQTQPKACQSESRLFLA